MYERALQLDAHFAWALVGLSAALSSRVNNGFSDAPEDDLRRADELVSSVLADEPNNPAAHRMKGTILGAQKRFEEAATEYETNIALDPTAVNGYAHLAWMKVLIEEPAKAIPLLEQAMKISPRDPFSIPLIQMRLGLANLLLGNSDEAIRWSEKAVLKAPYPGQAYRNRGRTGSISQGGAVQPSLFNAHRSEKKYAPGSSQIRGAARANYHRGPAQGGNAGVIDRLAAA
jgi:tetratricopeptide (TPR) repeat protein